MKRNVVGLAFASGLLAAWPGARAADPPPVRIYSCVDASGRKHVSQAPIAECADRDQVQRNSDGSIRRVIRRPLTEKEREAEDARARAAEADCRSRKIEDRAHRNLVKRFPDRAHHDVARQDAIDDATRSLGNYAKRIEQLLREKKTLDEEREFYPPGTPLPSNLRLKIERNDSALEAMGKLVTTRKDELDRINSRFDAELALLQKLWRTPPVLVTC